MNASNSHEAADGRKVTTSGEQFDDRELMFIVCRHDIALFFANIDSPGEQQKYAVALVEHLYSFLPNIATVVILYNVGCVLHRSIQLVSLSVFFTTIHLYSVQHPTPYHHFLTSVCNLSDA